MMISQHPHDNIVRFYDSHLVDDELWVVMEFVDGGSLTEIVRERRYILCLYKIILLVERMIAVMFAM